MADESIVSPERKFLLFQIDLAGEGLPEGLKPRWTYLQGVPDRPIAVSDYSDYDNPRTPLYWRNKLADNYGEELEDAFQNFAGNLFIELNEGRLKLRHTGDRPFLDLTPFVKTVSGYAVQAKDLANSMTLSLVRPEALVDASDDRLPDIKFGSLDGILPRENDIVMVLTRYPGGSFFQEYLGFITRIEDGSSYGQLDRYEIGIDGISKITKQSDIVRAQAINDQQFLPNIEINENNQVSVMEDQYNDKDVRGIFSSVLKSVFSLVPVNRAGKPRTGRFRYSEAYGLNPQAFCPKVVSKPGRTAGGEPRLAVQYPSDFGGFQHNFFALITLFMMTIEPSGDDVLFPTRTDKDETFASTFYYDQLKRLRADADGSVDEIPADDSGVILSPLKRAVIDHGGQSAFNLMIAHGFELFFSHMAKAEEIMGEIRNGSYYDLFESRDGTLVCRPPRYNKIERTTSETERQSVETPVGEDGIDVGVAFSLNEATSTWEFNRDSDFFIRKEEVIDIPSRVFDDDALESRVDMKLNMPLYGALNFPAASYTDPDVLLRFGLKTQGPISNPNAINSTAPKIFSPLVLAMVNAPSRTLTVRAKDTRRFFVGKAYYLESIDCVGLLVADDIGHAYNTVSSRNLGFSMLRRVVRRPLAEIKAGANGTFYEAINMAMSYMDDPPNSELFDPADVAQKLGLPGQIKNQLQLMQAKGLRLVDVLAAKSGGSGQTAVGAGSAGASPQGGPKVVMFRYLPTILDVAMEVDADNSIAEPDPKVKQAGTREQATKASLDKRVGAANIIDGRLSLTYLFQRPENQQFYEKDFFHDIVGDAENQFVNGVPAYLDPISPVIPAGSLNYGPASHGTDALGIWYEESVLPANPIDFVATPISAAALCEQPQNARISQLLVNKLASVDISMKFLPKSSLSAPIYPNYNAIPQLYFCDGSSFSLFAPGIDPNGFIRAMRAKAGLSAYDLLSDVTNSLGGGVPSVLRMNVGTSSLPNEVSNSFYRIQGSGGSFWLPAGHFLIKSPSPTADSLFVRVRSRQNPLLGGNIRITKGLLPNEVTLESADPSKYDLVIDDGSNGGDGKVVVGKLTRAVPAPGVLYFLTPFAEPTIERLMQFPLPVEFGGQVSQATVDQQKASLKSQPGGGKVFTANNKRITGDAVNVSVDYLAAASGSDLQAFPRRPLATPVNDSALQGIWKRFEQQLVAQIGVSANALAGFKSKDAAIPYRDALKVRTTYPGGDKPATDRLCLVYSLNITGANDPKLGLDENRKYAAAITPARPQQVQARG